MYGPSATRHELGPATSAGGCEPSGSRCRFRPQAACEQQSADACTLQSRGECLLKLLAAGARSQRFVPNNALRRRIRPIPRTLQQTHCVSLIPAAHDMPSAAYTLIGRPSRSVYCVASRSEPQLAPTERV